VNDLDPIPYPAPGSLGGSDAARWYLRSVRAIPDALGRDREAREMVQLAWQLKSRLRLAAALALMDQEEAGEFLRKMPLPTLDALFEEVGVFDPDAAQKALDMLLAISEAELCAFPTTTGGNPIDLDDGAAAAPVVTSPAAQGVAKGFPVRTPDGFKMIEEVKAGDLVLSAPPDGRGAMQPKRVVKVATHEGRSLRTMNTIEEGQEGMNFLAATQDQAFWVEGAGWTPVGALRRGAKLRTIDGYAEVESHFPVFRTETPGVGWVQDGSDWRTSEGRRFDYANGDLVEPVENRYLPPEIAASKERYLRVHVYELEVEDFHTYYVSGHWVRGA
jgi:hypothetical protein